MKRPLYNKQSFTELGVCQLENIVTIKIDKGLCFTSTAYLSVIIQIQNIFYTIVARLITHIVK